MRPPELNLATVRLIGHASRTPCEMTLQASWPGRSASLCKRAGWCRHPLFPALFELRAAPLKQIALTIWPGKRRITTILAEKRNYLQLRTCMTNAWQNGPTARESCKGKRGRREGGEGVLWGMLQKIYCSVFGQIQTNKWDYHLGLHGDLTCQFRHCCCSNGHLCDVI